MEVGGGMALSVSEGGEEAADMGVGSTLVEGEHRGVVTKETVVGMEVWAVDGGCGGSEAPRVACACKLALEVVLELGIGVLLGVGSDKGGAMGEAELEGEVEWCDAASSE